MSKTQELSPSGSIDRMNSSSKADKKPKTRRPPNTAFRQQRLKAWQPILTPKTVIPLFFIVGIIFAPIGGLLLWASAQVQELSIDYTNCATAAPTTGFSPMDSGLITSSFSSSNRSTDQTRTVSWQRKAITVPIGRTGKRTRDATQCSLQFEIPNNIGPPVYMYYRLTKFYQNHRRYVKSLDQNQLKGQAESNSSISGGTCDPLAINGTGFAYYPCGVIANSLFNDTISSPVLLNVQGSSAKNETYSMTDQGIAWSSDAKLYVNTSYKANQVAPPPNWMALYPDGYDDDEFPIPGINNWEAFQVWMRTAGLPTFSKLSRRNDNTAMTQGMYQLNIVDDFPAHVYGGTKEILISTRTVIGGKNPFLGIAYIIVGGLCILLGTVFTATHLLKPRKLGDHTYLTWNNEPSTATTTGRSLRPNEQA